MSTESHHIASAAELPAAAGQTVARTAWAVCRGLTRAIRPKQATKNLFVFAALIFAGDLFHADKLGRTVAAFLLFTILSGSVYLFNDILDVEQDRAHPHKRSRPIASGEVPISIAAAAALILAVGSLAAGAALSRGLGLAMVFYAAVQILYNVWLKKQVLLDVFAIAAGFVLRVVAGALVIDVSISHWLLLCSLVLALFLGFGKRRQELVLLGESAGEHRKILNEYSLPFLDQLIPVVTAVAIVCYAVYSVESATAHLHPHLWITVPFVFYALCRYMYLVYQKGWGGAPDEVLLKDRGLQAAIALWLICVLLLFALDKQGVPLPGLR